MVRISGFHIYFEDEIMRFQLAFISKNNVQVNDNSNLMGLRN